MNSLAEAWIARLKSGEYQQCSGHLYLRAITEGKGAYCALGVAMTLFDDYKPHDSGIGFQYRKHPSYIYRNCLPGEVWKALGLHNDVGGTLTGKGLSVVYLNDVRHSSLKVIGEVLENNSELYFL